MFDPFSGSGTTCVCANKLGRHFLGIEIDKEYWRKSIDRLNGISQIDREKMDNGQETLF